MSSKRKALSECLPEYVFDRIHQYIGQASMCWENPEKAGVFDTKQARDIAFELCHFVADYSESSEEERSQKQKEYKRSGERFEEEGEKNAHT